LFILVDMATAAHHLLDTRQPRSTWQHGGVSICDQICARGAQTCAMRLFGFLMASLSMMWVQWQDNLVSWTGRFGALNLFGELPECCIHSIVGRQVVYHRAAAGAARLPLDA
jgi:hypothetical protein